jgi:hypothetical protein
VSVTSVDPVWRPYVDQPLFVPELTLGYSALDPTDAARLRRYLTALVSHRGVVHTAVAFNAIYFGYDLTYGGYVGGPVDFDAFPPVAFDQTAPALPVGAMVNVAAGAEPLYAEVVYKEGAHPDLGQDGHLPGWLSGAPAGARGPGLTPDPQTQPVLHERLVIDVDAFGPGLVSPARLDRLRRRGRWLDGDGHLLLSARYPDAQAAEASDTEFYARFLLTDARDLLLAGPLPLLLTDDAGERHLATALEASLAAVADALAAVPALRVWREYAFPRAALANRLADPGPLGASDLASLAASVGRVSPTPARRGLPARPGVRHTAVGPLLRAVAGAGPQLVGLGYPAAVCHANAVIGDYARRDADETGALDCGAHLRLDDPWQGGGVWQATNPPGPYARIDPLVAYGLGWLDSLPGPADQPDPPVPDEDDLDVGATVLTVTDSHLSWTVTLRLAHTLAGVAAVPDRVAQELTSHGLVGAGLRLQLRHDGYDLEPDEATQAVAVTRSGRRLRLTGLAWPLEFFPGIVLTFTWQRGAVLVQARSTLLETPVDVDGEVYEHRYDPGVLTRDTAPGCVRRGEPARTRGPLSLRQRVLRAIRRVGHLDADGVAVLPRDQLPALVYGRSAGAGADGALDPVVDELLAEGVLSAEQAVRAGGGVHWPVPAADAAAGETGTELVTALVWGPRTVTCLPPARLGGAFPGATASTDTASEVVGPGQGGTGDGAAPAQPGADEDLARFLYAYEVAPFLRRLPEGQHASEEMRAEYRKILARFGRVGDLPRGHTLVRGHTRVRAW